MPGMILNDIYHDSTTSELKIIHDGSTPAEIYAEIVSAKYADKREPVDVPGAGGVSLGSTRGRYKAENGEIAMYLVKADRYLQKLKAIAAPRNITVCDLIQRLQVTYRLPGGEPITDIITYRLMGPSAEYKVAESGAIIRTFSIFVTGVSWNGVDLA